MDYCAVSCEIAAFQSGAKLSFVALFFYIIVIYAFAADILVF